MNYFKSLIIAGCILAISLQVKCIDDADLLESEIDAHFDEAKNSMSFVKFFTGIYYDGPYKTISNRLDDNVDVDSDLIEYFREAKLFLTEVKKKNTFGFSVGLVQALEQFISLKYALYEDTRCGRKSLKALVKNNKATRGVAYMAPTLRFLKRRVDVVISKVFDLHASECQVVYPKKYKAIIEFMDDEMLRRIDYVIERIQISQNKLHFSFPSPELSYNEENIMAIFRAVRALAKADPNFKSSNEYRNTRGTVESPNERVERALNTYFFGPCKYYIEHLGPDVFMPAEFDWGVLETPDVTRLQKPSEYSVGLVKYRYCHAAIRDKAVLLAEAIKDSNKWFLESW